ncbi:MAG: glycosyl hydrolase [Candidatus Solibacter sp.]|nr:glycosyl hydrolase [Candidatus Solibacter sp.]
MRRLLLALMLAAPLLADSYLFTSFRRNGETGVFFALSKDGRQWTPLNGNQPWLKPDESGMLMRDPWLGQGPDGTWHMLWTWGWTTKDTGGKLKIGYASSKDLIHWSPQRALAVMENEPTARNLWAPEAVWDPARSEWIVFWASTIPGRFADTEGTGDTGYNHRIYAATTKDWQTFSPAKLWFDPGFNCIDTTVVHDGKRWILVFKDERKNPQVKKLRLAFADSPAGPWKDVSEPFTGDWVEGPTVTKIGAEWWIYFDHYAAPRHYGAMRTSDWKTFEDMTPQVSFPADHRHGTVVRISDALARQLQGATPAP